MLQYVSSSQLVLLTVTIALKSVLVAVLLCRRTWREFPLFTAFVLIFCAKAWFLFYALHLSAEQYYFLYWQASAVQNASLLCATIEIAWDVLLPGEMVSYRAVRKVSYFAAFLVLIWFAMAHCQHPTHYRFLNSNIAFERACGSAASSILGVVLLASVFYTIRWQRTSTFIAGGMSGLCLLTIILPASQYFVTLTRSVSIVFSLSAECLILAVWVRTFAVVSMPSFSMGGREQELLRLLEFGKKLKHEAEIL